MIVSKLKLDFSAAPWASVNNARTRAEQLFHAVIRKDDASDERASGGSMSLGEVLYCALVEQVELAN